ncbi:60S ribosomal export protein NMD3 [Archaeoglobus veneficus]|uniref:60S ribosomal export protein NMD3 n=1 Tax=Archaeoglobus veneficus TaxID=58290 RepID=UPI000B263742|nr:NMD3-related protein [Archaeoglobus veneficus]
MCGKESSSTICASCYIERNEIVWLDDIIRLTTCPRCGFFRIGGRWKSVGYDEALTDALYSSLRVHPDFEVSDVEVGKEGGKYIVHISGSLWGEGVEVSKTFEARVTREICQRCSREAGGYYESIVQVRADGRDIEEEEFRAVREIIEAVLDKERENMKAFISKIVERKEGIDYYIGDRNIGRKISRRIAEELGGAITESKKISGRKDGRDVYRFTYSVRLPAYRKGDIVEQDGRLAVVTNPRLGKSVSIESGETINLKKPKLVARSSDVVKSVVINVDAAAIEVLHPVTHEVVTAVRPKASFRPGDEVYTFEYEGRVYVIPEELMRV